MTQSHSGARSRFGEGNFEGIGALLARRRAALAALACLGALCVQPAAAAGPPPAYAPMIARYARQHGVPERLIHRIIMRESRYNPGVVSKGNYGLMQIKLGTARGMGYAGGAQGLLDPDVNMRHAVPYLANAYIVARGDEDRAVRYYAGGYYYAAKRLGLLDRMRTARSGAASATALAQPTAATREQTASRPREPVESAPGQTAYAAEPSAVDAVAAIPAVGRKPRAASADEQRDDAPAPVREKRATRKTLARAPTPPPRPVEAAEPAPTVAEPTPEPMRDAVRD